LIIYNHVFEINIHIRHRISKDKFRTKNRIIIFDFSASRFQLQLVTEQGRTTHDETHLRVIEISKFKHLTHVSLLVTPASDYEIKNYLARRLQVKTVSKIIPMNYSHVFFFTSKSDYNQLTNDYDKLKRELELTQLV
jgi:hypothetical protein